MDFFSLLDTAIEKNNSLLCVGIDPQDVVDENDVFGRLLHFGKNIVDATLPFAACFKPNIAFYEVYGPEGLRALKALIQSIPDEMPVIIDCKRGDIGNTARAYAQELYGYYDAHAVTLNVYMGRESAEPFLDWEEKGIFALCRTSNPGAGCFQGLSVKEGAIPYYLYVAEEVSSWSDRIGLVVGANMPLELSKIRQRLPDIWILAPGIGVQGGKVSEALSAGMRKDGRGILLNASRSIAKSSSPAEAAEKLRDEINSFRRESSISLSWRGADLKDESAEEIERKGIARALIRLGCFKTGQFKLKSGQVSPIYLDLRLLISNPPLLSRVAGAYAEMMKGLDFDCIAGIPMGGVPLATAVSLLVKCPMIFPRMTSKGHGSGRMVEGLSNRGDRAVLLDDLITTGKSKLEAIKILQGEGIRVEDLVVLVERGTSGRKELEEAGIRLHAYLDIDEILEVCREMGQITDAEIKEIKFFIRQS